MALARGTKLSPYEILDPFGRGGSYDIGHQDGIDFMVMEHIEGETGQQEPDEHLHV